MSSGYGLSALGEGRSSSHCQPADASGTQPFPSRTPRSCRARPDLPVTGHEQNGPKAMHFVGQGFPSHSRHDDIGHEGVNHLLALDKSQRLFTARGTENAVAKSLENPLRRRDSCSSSAITRSCLSSRSSDDASRVPLSDLGDVMPARTLSATTCPTRRLAFSIKRVTLTGFPMYSVRAPLPLDARRDRRIPKRTGTGSSDGSA